MWLVAAGTVTKLRASDGATVGAFTLNGGRSVAFDGVNIWVAGSPNNLTELRVSDGATLNTFLTVGSGPQAVAFDGANIWVASGNFVSRF